MSYLLEFEIQKLPKMPNELLGARWSVRAGHAKVWQREVWAKVWPLRPESGPLKKAKLTLVRCSSRRPDNDGLSGSFKAVIDALVKNQIIIDDTDEVIGWPTYLHETTSPRKGGIRVKVEGVE